MPSVPLYFSKLKGAAPLLFLAPFILLFTFTVTLYSTQEKSCPHNIFSVFQILGIKLLPSLSNSAVFVVRT